MLTKEISALINYSIKNKFLPLDKKDLLLKSNFNKDNNLISKISNYKNNNYGLMWKKITDHLEFNNLLDQDIFTDELASYIVGDNEYIEKIFYSFKNNKKSMIWFENLCKFTTYIKQDRIKKNIFFKNDKYIVSFNKSKPEKTPEQIKEAAKNKSKISILSINQVGLKGNASQNPRMAHRVINLPFFKNKWFIQYSPYQYFNKHSILISKDEEKMKINQEAIKTMIDFLGFLPNFNISLNADLPIVGGSILNHMHFQTGQFNFPIYNSKKNKIRDNVYFLDWPISTILVENEDKNTVLKKVWNLINLWKNYSTKESGLIFSKKHNTVSLSARFHKNKYQFYILLRNNYVNKDYPDGMFHVPKKYQIIKKENIGVIEACGLGIFPGRLDFSSVKNSKNKDFIRWKKQVDGFKDEKEYHEKILKTFEIILLNCNPLKKEKSRKLFLNNIKNKEENRNE